MQNNIVLEIGDFLGFCDLNGIEALQSDQVEQLEEYIRKCNASANAGEDLVPNAIWDRLMDILRAVNPDSELCKYSWEDAEDTVLDDTDRIVTNNPMFSIQTVKSYDCDEMKGFVERLPDDEVFTAHISVKLNGHGIRLKYADGKFLQARSRARSSAGRDITAQLGIVLGASGLLEIEDLENLDLCEVRGEWLLPFYNMETARQFNPDIKSAFSGVASMGRDSASEEEWGLLRFVAYEFLADGMNFQSKEEEYSFLEELGFETPMNWVVEDLQKEGFVDELRGIVSDCISDVTDGEGYDYYTDGLVFSINDINMFRSMGDDGTHYKFGNIALKLDYWKQDMYTGYVQTVLWTKGKTKISPVVIVAESPDMIEFVEDHDTAYCMSQKEIANWESLGVVTASGNRVRRIPLYEPSNLMVLDAYIGNPVYFRYGGEAGVVPCFEDGTTLLDGRIQNVLEEDGSFIDEWVD